MVFSILIAILIPLNLLGFLVDNLIHLVIINVTILSFYLILRPSTILHPNNVVFAFSALYVVLPSTVYIAYELLGIEYVLPWGKLFTWDQLSKTTYFHALFMFIFPFLLFRLLIGNAKNRLISSIPFNLSVFELTTLSILVLAIVWMFVQLTGGLSSWLEDYQNTYLTKKQGYGHINFIILYFGNLIVFLLGLCKIKRKNVSLILVYLLGIVLILTISYVQGLKSRMIFLVLLFFLPEIQPMRLNVKRLFLLGIGFFCALFVGNYYRSGGYYANQTMFIEYMISYFNSYPLHDMLIKNYDAALLQTAHYPFMKPLIKLGLVAPGTDYDISVMLTKEFFPDQWANSRSTQQWPLVSEFHLNYFGLFLGWLPFSVYIGLIALLYRRAIAGDLGFMLIYMIELIRLFSTFRGTLIPWETPVFLVFYIVIYFLANAMIRTPKPKSLNERPI